MNPVKPRVLTPIRCRARGSTPAFRAFPKHHIASTLSQRFEEIAHANPDRIAVETRDAGVTYETLNTRANSIAAALLDRLGETEEAVGVLLPPGAEATAALLGISKAGKYFVPLDPSYPAARNRFVLEDSGARACVANAAANGVAEGRMVVNLSAPLPRQLSNVVTPTGPDSIAYLFYTSGSTGQPKGVVQTHRNALHFLRNYINGLQICAEDRLSMLYSLGNSAMLMDTFAALLTGAVVLPFGVAAEGPVHLRDWLIRSRITVYHSVASVFRTLATAIHDQRFPDLRLLDFGGEPVLRSDFEIYRRCFDDRCVFVNGFGVTELNVIRQFFADKNTRIEQARVPVGYPVEDTEVLLEDDEIVIRSRYLATGYWRRPELTAAAFEAGADGVRRYRTGDLGRLDDDGCLSHLGRKDFQVKVAGNRVELAEVEVALREHAGLTDATVSLCEFAPGDERLVAWCVLGDTPLPAESQLREKMATFLPGHMVPASFVRVDELPRTASGKIDRKALALPKTAKSHLATGTATETERRLARLWEECLGAPAAGLDQSFFDAGGSSFLAARLVSAIEDVFQRDPATALLFQIPTIRQMARVLDDNRKASNVFPLQPMGSRPPLILLGAQPYRTLFSTMLPPDQPLFGLDMTRREMLRTGRPVSMERVCRALKRQILEFQPQGPFYLGGHSLWGVYAFAVAAMLEEEGHRVGLVALIDSYCRTALRSPVRTLKMTLRLLWSVLPGTPEQDVFSTLRWACEFSGTPIVRAPVLLLAAKESSKGFPVPAWQGWERFAPGGLGIRSVPGDHNTMLREPNLQTLGQQLDEFLRAAQTA